MSATISVGADWVGLEHIKYLVVFGDSFSTVGYSSKDPHPSVEHPLGVVFPGLTSCERVDATTEQVVYEPNWVGHLVESVNRQRQSLDSPLLAYDYAVSGDTVARMKLWQVEKEFMPILGRHPDWAPWSSSDALFVTWIGINDCVWNIRIKPSTAQASFDDLFAMQEKFYEIGARNFCLIDVPLMHKFPAGIKRPMIAKGAYTAWNATLRERAESFSVAHPGTTMLIFSSSDVFARVLSDLQSAGFLEDEFDVRTLFVDGFHPSSRTHAVVARELQAFLQSIPPMCV